jgi:hypothetical protein
LAAVWLALMLVQSPSRPAACLMHCCIARWQPPLPRAVMKENLLIVAVQFDLPARSKTRRAPGRRALQQMQVVVQQFREHPVIGSGATAIHIILGPSGGTQSGGADATESEALAYISDLGYASVLKGYGLLGLSWLTTFMLTLFIQAYRAYQQGNLQQRTLALFALGYLLFVTISGITLNHFMYGPGILMLCLVAALLARLRYEQIHEKVDLISH